MLFKIRKWFKKLLRAIDWFFFMMRQPYWNEYETFLAIMRKYLLTMADEFERTRITMSSLQKANRIRLCAELLRRFREEYYSSNLDLWENPVDDSIDAVFNLSYKPGKSYQDIVNGWKKDQKALNLAMRIIAQDLPGWWQ